MRRQDKAKNMERVNILFEQRMLEEGDEEKPMINEVIKFTKTAPNKYQVTINNIEFKVTPNNYSYYKQYDLTAKYPDGSYVDYSDEFMPNLKTVREFIKSIIQK
jgi:hypothetical protein